MAPAHTEQTAAAASRHENGSFVCDAVSLRHSQTAVSEVLLLLCDAR
jgi:hypothetical protein